MSNNIALLTPAILRTLATGIDRLNDGDEADCATSYEVEKALARAGYVVSNGQAYPAADCTHGFMKDQDGQGVYTFVVYAGNWEPAVEPGTVLFLDRDCTVPVRTVEDPNEYAREDSPQQT